MISIRLKTSALFYTVSFLAGALALLAQEPPSTRVIVKPDTVFFHAVGTGNLPDRQIRIQQQGPPTEGLTFTAASTSDFGWLSATPLAGPVPNTLTLTANPGTLEPGTYEGEVTVIPVGIEAEPQTVRVVLRVLTTPGGAPAVFARPRALVFRMFEGGDPPDARAVTVSSPTGGADFMWTATHEPMDWLHIDSMAGTGPGTITATVVGGSSLPAGQYDGSITVTSGDTSVEVRVMLLVLGPEDPGGPEEPGGPGKPGGPGGPGGSGREPNLVINPRAFNFIMHPGGTPPGPKTMRVKSAGHGSGSFEWIAEVSSDDGWLSITVSGATTPGTVELMANPNGLAPGHYPGMVQVSAGEQTKKARVWLRIVGGGDGDGLYSDIFRSLAAGSVALTGIATQQGVVSAAFGTGGDLEGSSEVVPAIFPGGVVSAASFAPDPTPVAPGSLVSMFGLDLTPATQFAASQPLPRELAGVQVLVRGIAAPLLAVAASDDGSSQIHFQIPVELAGVTYADVVVDNNGVFSAPQGIHIWPALPALFTSTMTGTGTAVALHGDFAPVTMERPTTPGETILLYATGLGETRPSQVSGEPAAGEAPATGKATVTIGGHPATVHYAGAAPGFVGLYQINVTAPESFSPAMLRWRSPWTGLARAEE